MSSKISFIAEIDMMMNNGTAVVNLPENYNFFLFKNYKFTRRTDIGNLLE